jgi:hypothetical protein
VQTHDTGVYSPEALAMLYRVFDESFRIATGNGPVRSGWQDDVRFQLAQVIMCGAARGGERPSCASTNGFDGRRHGLSR